MNEVKELKNNSLSELMAAPAQPEFNRILDYLTELVVKHEQLTCATSEKLKMIKHRHEDISDTANHEKCSKSVIEEMHYLLDRLERSIRTAEDNLNHLSELI